MRLAALFSGGKDSSLAVQRAMEDGHEVAWLVSITPETPESYMFHFPNTNLTELQAESAGIPLVRRNSHGRKEEEVRDIEKALAGLKGVEGVVAGALASRYQAERVKSVCDSLGIEMVAPLWGIEEDQLWLELMAKRFRIMIVGVACQGLGREWLGKVVDEKALRELDRLSEKYSFHLGGEGGEFETLALDAPFFRKRISVDKARTEWKEDSGFYHIEKASLRDK